MNGGIPLRVLDRLGGAPDPAASARFESGTAAGSPVAWILSYTGVSNEPRVLRQAWSLLEAGWQVVVAGFDGHSPRPPGWSYLRLADRPLSRALPFRVALRLQGIVGKALYRGCAGVPPLAQLGARLFYFSLANWRQNHAEIVRAAAALPELKPDLVVAHDYHTCPPAAELARRSGAALVVDCHEYARGQYMHDAQWRRDGRLFSSALQDDFLARADAVTTVCDGIARLLDAEQRLKRPVTVLRSMPFSQPQTFRPCGTPITVLYHGVVSDDRGLDETIRSVPLWRGDFRLVIRGGGEAATMARLKALASDLGVAERVTFEPPVPFARIVPAANQADIGFFVQPDLSPQKRFALPNKFFEYVMAGLALCVADLPEMAALLRRYDLGRLVTDLSPEGIAGVINGFTPESIEAYKRASLAAAAELNWEVEQRTMMDLFQDLVSGRCVAPAARPA